MDYLLSSSYLRAADTNNIRFQLHVQPTNGTPGQQQPQQAQPGDAQQEADQKAIREALTGIPPELLSFSLTPSDFKLLYADLKQAKQMFANV